MSGTLVTGENTGRLFGSNYTLQVQGYAQLPFDYTYNYSISGQQESGVHVAFSEGAYYTPSDPERSVKFLNSSGIIVGDITGFVSGAFTGSGIVRGSFNDYYFYDTGSNRITFSESVTGYAVVGTHLTGKYNILTQNTINSAIIVGGALSNQTYFSTFSSGANISGRLLNIPYQEDNVTGFYKLSGFVTGNSVSGKLNYTNNVSGQYIEDIDNLPYYYIPTGLVTASAMVKINFAALKNYDYLAINSNAISYYSTPNSNYFNSISGLLSTINASPLAYNVSGKDLNDDYFSGAYSGITGVMLYSLLSGASGNNITISSDTTSGIIVPSGGYLTGGQNLYSILFNTSIFTGVASGALYQTGFYNKTLPTGRVSGLIPTYQYTRNFVNTWGIATGLPRNLVNYNSGKLTQGGYFGITSGDRYLGTYENIVWISLNYFNHYNNPNTNSADIIDLYITGYNFPSGTGIIFRITGTK